MCQTIIGGIFGLVGVILGWLLNVFSEKYFRKSKLCFSLQITANQDELDPYELRTKTSESGYGIEIINFGQVPVIVNYIRLYYKKKFIVDCFMMDKLIMPYDKAVYNLTIQDIDNIKYQGHNNDIRKCSVKAYDVNGKVVKGKLDLCLIIGVGRNNIIWYNSNEEKC